MAMIGKVLRMRHREKKSVRVAADNYLERSATTILSG